MQGVRIGPVVNCRLLQVFPGSARDCHSTCGAGVLSTELQLQLMRTKEDSISSVMREASQQVVLIHQVMTVQIFHSTCFSVTNLNGQVWHSIRISYSQDKFPGTSGIHCCYTQYFQRGDNLAHSFNSILSYSESTYPWIFPQCCLVFIKLGS